MDTIERVYQNLRAQILARHFAMGRYYPAYHFTSGNALGEWPDCALPSDGVTLIPRGSSGCVPRKLSNGSWVPRYKSADKLLELEVDQQLIERWRVWRHDRTNSLTMAGLRITSLAIEHRLGSTIAMKAIERWLDTVEGLFKWRDTGSPFEGYVLRWDPATSDRWEAEIDAKGHEAPIQPCDFLSNPDPRTAKHAPILYCTPLRDSRYTDGDFDRDKLRLAEPSIDEYTGLVTAYLQIHEALMPDLDGKDQLRAEVASRIMGKVRTQMTRVARYLQAFAYILVRPCGGFTFGGSAENNPCLEYPFSRAFERVLGDPFSVTGTFEGAMRAADVYECVFPTLSSFVFGDDAGQRVADLSFLSVLKSNIGVNPRTWLSRIGVTTADFDRASGLLLRDSCFDVHSDNPGQDFALAFLLSKAARRDAATVFAAWMANPAGVVAKDPESKHDSSHDYKILLGLIADATGDHVIRDAYFRYFDHGMTGTSDDPEKLADSTRDRALPTAIALLLSRAPVFQDPFARPTAFSSENQTFALRKQLRTQLDGMAQKYLRSYGGGPVISDEDGGLTSVSKDEDPGICCNDGGAAPMQRVFEYQDKVGSYHGFSTAVTIGWLHAQKTHTLLPWPELPLPSHESIREQWKPATIPIEVLDQIVAQKRLPIAPAFLVGINPGALHEIDLLQHAPPRPPDDSLGRPEMPSGRVNPINESGGFLLDRTLPLRFPIPPRPVADPLWDQTHILVLSPENLRGFKADLRLTQHRVDGAWIVVDLWLGAGWRRPFGQARMEAELVISWCRK